MGERRLDPQRHLMHGHIAQASHLLAQSSRAARRRLERVYWDIRQLIGKTLGHPSDVRPQIEHRSRPHPAAECQQVNPCVRLSKQTTPRAASSTPPPAKRLNIPERLPYGPHCPGHSAVSVIAGVTVAKL